MKFAPIFCSLVFMVASGAMSFAQVGAQPDQATTQKDGQSNADAALSNEARTQKAMANIEKAISVMIPGGIAKGTPRQKNFAAVIDLFGRGQARDAMDALKKMSAEDPQLPPAEILMAGLTFAVGDNKSGNVLLESSAVKHPNYPGVYLSFAQIALNTGRITDASLHADKAATLIESESLSPEKKNHFLKQYYEVATGIYLRRKQNQQADDALEKLQTVSPNLPFYFFSKAELAFRAEQYEPTLQFLRQHASAIESKRLPELTLVDWLKSTGKQDESNDLLVKTLEKNPGNGLAQMMAAQMYMAREEFPNALVSLKRFVEINGEESDKSIDMKGRIAFAGGSYEFAADHFRDLNKRTPNDPSSANIYALCLIESEDPEKRKQAQQISEQVARRLSNNPLALASLAYIYQKNGEKERAQRLMANVAMTRQTTPEISFFLSHWLNENGQSDKAAEILQQAIDSKGLFLYRSAARKLLATIKSQ
jgi:predicted Zn-dependent protease